MVENGWSRAVEEAWVVGEVCSRRRALGRAAGGGRAERGGAWSVEHRASSVERRAWRQTGARSGPRGGSSFDDDLKTLCRPLLHLCPHLEHQMIVVDGDKIGGTSRYCGDTALARPLWPVLVRGRRAEEVSPGTVCVFQRVPPSVSTEPTFNIQYSMSRYSTFPSRPFLVVRRAPPPECRRPAKLIGRRRAGQTDV
jgi:hypothetical protein